MLLTIPGDFVATTQRGELTHAAPPPPALNFEDTRVGRGAFALIVMISLAVTAWQFGWLA